VAGEITVCLSVSLSLMMHLLCSQSLKGPSNVCLQDHRCSLQHSAVEVVMKVCDEGTGSAFRSDGRQLLCAMQFRPETSSQARYFDKMC
jgi:hypothetical protein